MHLLFRYGHFFAMKLGGTHWSPIGESNDSLKSKWAEC